MISDVPLGAFLSGGIDSSLIVALMQSQVSHRVKTFCIGYDAPAYDESPFARGIARHLGTDHTELVVSDAEVLDLVPRVSTFYDEPFADMSQVPTLLVSQLARRTVTVSLSGDGGDELFGGYGRYRTVQKLALAQSCVPALLRQAAARGLWHANTWAGRGSAHLLPRRLSARFSRTTSALGALSAADNRADLYAALISVWRNPEEILSHGFFVPGRPQARPWAHLPTVLDELMLADSTAYLPDDILVKLDRATMAFGLEGRIPYIDPEVAEIAWHLPLSLKQKGGSSKRVLRDLLALYVPPALYERPKMGFGFPTAQLLRGPLRDWAEAMLDPRRIRSHVHLNADSVESLWSDHLRGHADNAYRLWTVLMFQSWLDDAPPAGRSPVRPADQGP